MADSPTKTKPKNFVEYLKVEASLIERRKKLFEALNAFVAQQGGWVVSPPNEKSLRIEVLQNSTLPVRLAELGYAPRLCGSGTRIVPNATTETFDESAGRPVVRNHGGIIPVDIIEITLG